MIKKTILIILLLICVKVYAGQLTETVHGHLIVEDKLAVGTTSAPSVEVDVDGDITASGDLTADQGFFGTVGIGTTAPTSKLHVETSAWNVGDDTPLVNITNLDVNEVDSNALLVRGGANNSGAQTFEVKDYTGNTDFVVTGAGQVGIGTDNPGDLLHIQGTGANDATIRVDGGATEGNAILELIADDAGHNADIKRIMSEASTGNLVFDYYNGAFQTGFVMDSAGKVGIGTTDPQVALDVVGDVDISGNILELGSDATGESIYIYFNDDANRDESIYWDDFGDRFVCSDMFSADDLRSVNDIQTQGAGDDLWLGNATQGSANFQAYATGEVRIDADNIALKLGEAQDATITFDDNSLNIVANAITSADDLEITTDGMTVTLGSSAGRDFNVDNVLYVEGDDNKVGILNSDPTVALDVVGEVKVAGEAGATGAAATDVLTVTGGAGGASASAAGGKGSDLVVTAGAGGDSTWDNASGNGGAGGDMTFTTGAGGDGQTGYGDGSDGGDIHLITAAGGTGDTAGSYGDIYLAEDGGYVGIGTTSAPSVALDVVGDAIIGDGTNQLKITDGVVTLEGTAKRILNLRPDLDFTKVTAQGKPTQVVYGAFLGYSLPLYAADEELFFDMNTPGRWDGASDVVIHLLVALSVNEDINDDFNLQISWEHANLGELIENTTHDVEVETNLVAGRVTAYDTYQVVFILDFDVDTPDLIESHDLIAMRLRRIAVDGESTEIDGEIIVFDYHMEFVANKMFGAP